MKTIPSLITLLFISISAFAQDVATAPETVEMADVMRSNGKIYIVISVMSIVFAGIVVYLVSIDRKVAKLEKHDEESTINLLKNIDSKVSNLEKQINNKA